MTEDKLSLENTKEILRYGNVRLWSYTFERINGQVLNLFAVTKGINLINHIDYISVYDYKSPIAIGYDKPERFSKIAKEKILKKVQKTLDIQNEMN